MKKQRETEVNIIEINQGKLTFFVRGLTPFIFNAMSEKAKHELLLPKRTGKKTAADKAQSFKHNPLEEFRGSVYRTRDNKASARLIFPAAAFKKAMGTAALDIPGAQKTQIGRLVWVSGDMVEIYGVPRLHMSVVRTADMKRTPDIRTRAILPEWACKITVQFVKPAINEQSIFNLLAAAGVTVGVGDFRQEKGAGNYGQFALVPEKDADFARIVKAGGLKQQDAALESPEMYDIETEQLYAWFNAEILRRTGKREAA
jgi:hypothetical protein